MRTFWRFLIRQGITTYDLAADATGIDSPLRRIRPTYGKVQSAHPARFLTREEADRLIAAANTGGPDGLQNELIVRLGLLGMRVAEIAALTFRAVEVLPHITWTGKGRKPRKVTAGSTLVRLLADWQRHYSAQLGRPVRADDPIFCAREQHAPQPGTWGQPGTRPLAWGQPIGARATIHKIVTAAAHRADLGHVAPHDLRRSAAAILHHARTPEGAHHFDLLDIQRVLGHTDPNTTVRCYLAPNDSATIDRAADFLD